MTSWWMVTMFFMELVWFFTGCSGWWTETIDAIFFATQRWWLNMGEEMFEIWTFGWSFWRKILWQVYSWRSLLVGDGDLCNACKHFLKLCLSMLLVFSFGDSGTWIHERSFCLDRKELRSSEWLREFDMLREHRYCWEDVVTDRGTKQGDKAEDRFSAMGLTAFAKKSGITSGWESGNDFMFLSEK